MATVKTQTNRPDENQLAQKDRREASLPDGARTAEDRPVRPARPASRGNGPGILSRSAALQMQRRAGNKFVQRQLSKNRHGLAGKALVQRAPADEQQPAGPTSIGDGSASLTAEGGRVIADAAMVELNAGIVRTSGVLQADTLVADSVVASSYTPGAGNVQ